MLRLENDCWGGEFNGLGDLNTVATTRDVIHHDQLGSKRTLPCSVIHKQVLCTRPNLSRMGDTIAVYGEWKFFKGVFSTVRTERTHQY